MKPGRWMGIIIFVVVLLMYISHYVLSLFIKELNNPVLSDIETKALGVFTLVWTYVFGSGAIKTLKGSSNEKENQ